MSFDWWAKLALDIGGPAFLISWIAVIIVSITLHELAHGWAAMRLGDDTPLRLGHMTWNPVVHMGPMSLIAFALFGFAWGAMPIDASRLRGRWGALLVAVAGPLMNIGLASLAIVAHAVWLAFAQRAGVSEPMYGNALRFFWIAASLNIFLVIFNLLPIFPLDGGRVAAELSDRYAAFVSSENGNWVMLGGFLLFFWFASDMLFSIAIQATEAASGVLGLLLALF
ncbi:MAG: site-2 protease family protein [Planctomycetota bacterium]